jgi:predicted nuclease with TOPRIM domain
MKNVILIMLVLSGCSTVNWAPEISILEGDYRDLSAEQQLNEKAKTFLWKEIQRLKEEVRLLQPDIPEFREQCGQLADLLEYSASEVRATADGFRTQLHCVLPATELRSEAFYQRDAMELIILRNKCGKTCKEASK